MKDVMVEEFARIILQRQEVRDALHKLAVRDEDGLIDGRHKDLYEMVSLVEKRIESLVKNNRHQLSQMVDAINQMGREEKIVLHSGRPARAIHEVDSLLNRRLNEKE